MTVCLLVCGELYDGTPCKGGGCECDNFSNHLRKNLTDMVFWEFVLPWAEVGNRFGNLFIQKDGCIALVLLSTFLPHPVIFLPRCLYNDTAGSVAASPAEWMTKRSCIAPPCPQSARCPLRMKYLTDQLIIDMGELFRVSRCLLCPWRISKCY